MFSLIPFEAFPRWFAGGAVDADIGHALNPVLHVLTHVFLIPEDFTVEAILLDVLNTGFHLALALRVIAFAGMDPESSRGGILMKPLVERQFAVLFVDHHQLGLIVNALIRQATEVPQGFVMELDKRLGIQRAEGQAHVHQPRVRQHEHHKMQRAFFATDQHAAQLTGVHLTLNTGHILQNGLVIAHLGRGHFLLEHSHITANGAI